MSPSTEARLPSPGVRFGDDFAQRVGSFVVRLASRAQRRDGGARASLFGAGEEFVGYRPYGPGEDLRHVDWPLLARHDQPFVRVHRREASEDWAILLDSSASMGVGVPGKLQCAAEVAAAIAASGLRVGARVTLWAAGPGATAVDRLSVRRRGAPRSGGIGGGGGPLGAVLAFLEARRASGRRGVAELFDPARLAGAGRVFALGDLFDLEPAHLPRIARRGRELQLVRVLAVEELLPGRHDAIEWVDPEDGESLRARVDARTEARYESVVSEELERWRHLAARHRVPHAAFRSDRPFEDIAQAVLAS